MSFCFQLAKALRKGPYQTNLLLAGYDANEGENNSQIATNLIWQNTRNSNIFNFITTFISHSAIPGPPLEVFWIIFSLSLPFSLHLLSLSLTLSISLSLMQVFLSITWTTWLLCPKRTSELMATPLLSSFQVWSGLPNFPSIFLLHMNLFILLFSFFYYLCFFHLYINLYVLFSSENL